MKDDKKNNPMDKTGGLDWESIKQRLMKARTVADKVETLTSTDRKRILRQRALAIAREEQSGIEDKKVSVVEFLLAHEKYGIEVSPVREVYPVKELIPLPGTPDFVAGIINVRSRIISVIDIKKLFNLPERGLTDLNKAIIISSEQMEFGILADEVLHVRSLPRSELQVSVPTLAGIREDYLLGIARDQSVILDGYRLLSDSKFIVDYRDKNF